MNISEALAKQAQARIIQRMQDRQKVNEKLHTVLAYLHSINENRILDQSERAQLDIAIDKIQLIRRMLPRSSS